jgi:hypothetical protein
MPIDILRKDTLVVGNHECRIEKINNEPYIVISFKGISVANYKSIKRTWGKQKQQDIFIPLYYLPYLMRSEREKIAEWESGELETIARIKKAFNTEIQPIK